MTALLLLTHQPAEAVNRMVERWKTLTSPDQVVVAYGGPPEEIERIEGNRVLIQDPRLRTKDHPREKQSYTEVLRKACEALKGEAWEHLYLAEFDIEPVVPDLFARLKARSTVEDADLLGHRAWRIDDTLHPHYASHGHLTAWRNWVRSISCRKDSEVVLSCMGCGQWWRRAALEAVLEKGEPHPAYLEVHLPTVAHHLGFRVRGMGDQDAFIRTEPLGPRPRSRMIDQGAWAIHPVKTLWSDEVSLRPTAGTAACKVLHLTHFDPPLHGEAMMACLLRECAAGWDDIGYRPINTAYATTREALTGMNLGKLVKAPWYLLRMTVELIRFRPDILLLQPAFHPGPFLKDSLFVWLARVFGVRVAAWVHMDPARLKLEERPGWFRKWVALTLEQIDPFVACAPALVEQWPDWISRRPCVAIANAIHDPAPETSSYREEDPARRLRILYISAMDREKGWRNLLEAARTLCEVHPNIEFEFRGGVGVGESEEGVREAFSASGFPDRIQWNGPIWGEEKSSCLLRADLFVLPSWTEQFPLAVLEAMACGLPIVATNVGAVSDALIVPDGGELVVADDARALAEAMDRIIRLKSEARRGKGLFNRRRYAGEYTLHAFGLRWRQLLHSLGSKAD